MDFEKGARKAIKKVFPKCKLLGCYFHYTKALWNKAKKQGLFKKEIFKDTYTLIFSLKIYVFIPTEEKKEYLERLKNLYKEKRQFKSFLYYFEKYWSVNDFLNFEDCDRTDFIDRTDNACENFHNNLNKLVGISHPKISFLIDKIKIYTKGQFDKLIDCLLLKIENIQKTYSVYEDIFNFTKKIKNKYNIKLNPDLIDKLAEEDKKNLFDLSLNIIEKVLNIDLFDDHAENNEDDYNNEMSDEQIKDSIENENIENDIKFKDLEYNDIFENEKNGKLNRGKNFELTDFYVINDDLQFKKTLKIEKQK